MGSGHGGGGGRHASSSPHLWVHAVNKHGCEQQLLASHRCSTGGAAPAAAAAAAAGPTGPPVSPAAPVPPVPSVPPHAERSSQLARLLDDGAPEDETRTLTPTPTLTLAPTLTPTPTPTLTRTLPRSARGRLSAGAAGE